MQYHLGGGNLKTIFSKLGVCCTALLHLPRPITAIGVVGFAVSVSIVTTNRWVTQIVRFSRYLYSSVLLSVYRSSDLTWLIGLTALVCIQEHADRWKF
jgi:hypothetical protein